MHCPNCGQKTSKDVKFCRSCGLRLDPVARIVDSYLKGGTTQETRKPEVVTIGSDRMARGLAAYVIIGFLMIVVPIACGLYLKDVPIAMYMASTFAVAGVIITVLGVGVTLIREARTTSARSVGQEVDTSKLTDSPTNLALNDGNEFEPVSSVTEGTTKLLTPDDPQPAARSLFEKPSDPELREGDARMIP